MKIFNEREKSALKSAFLEYERELPSDEQLQGISFSDGFENGIKKLFKRQKTVALRRAVAICACLAVIVTAIGFFAKPQDIPDVTPPQVENESEGSGEGLIVQIGEGAAALSPFTKDIFIAKVISVGKVTDDSDFGNYVNFNATPMLYTVKVSSAILSQTVTEGTTIKLVHYVAQDKNKSYFSHELKKGKKYLFSGITQPYKQSAVFVDTSTFISQINKDNLTPVSSVSQNYLNGITTLSGFKNSKIVKELCEIDNSELPSAFDECIIKKDDDIISVIKGIATQEDYEYYLKTLKDTIKVNGKNVFTTIECEDELANKFYQDPFDIFTAKIVKRVGTVDATDFTDIENKNGTPVLYHAEVQSTIWSSFIETNQTIKVVVFENKKALETGKTYLLSGVLQPHENSAVCVDTKDFISEIKDDKFIYLSEQAEKNLKGIDTLADFRKCRTVLELNIYYRVTVIYPAFKKYSVKNTENGNLIVINEHTKPSEIDYYTSVIKQAIKVGSDVTITKMEG